MNVYAFVYQNLNKNCNKQKVICCAYVFFLFLANSWRESCHIGIANSLAAQCHSLHQPSAHLADIQTMQNY